MKIRVLIWAVAIFTLLSSVNLGSAEEANQQPVFTIYPSYTHQGNKSWLIYDVKPGDTVKDYLTVENFSNFPAKLKVYFVEGEEKGNEIITDTNGQFNHLGSLISPGESFLELNPGEKRKIEFLYSLPTDFKEGKYVGIFYAEPFADESAAQVAIKTRIGVRTYVNVGSVQPPISQNWSFSFYQVWFLLLSAMAVLLAFLWGLSQKGKRGSKKIALLAALFFSFNFLPLADAQNMEIEVEGAGYRILGPDNILLPDITASFDAQTSTVDFEDLVGDSQDLEIIDENGGVPFTVSVSSTALTDGSTSVSNTNIEIKNYDGDGDSISVVEGSDDEVALSADTDSFASLDVARTLFQADSFVSPGQWRIYPAVRVTIPAGTGPGTYQSTLTFTIN